MFSLDLVNAETNLYIINERLCTLPEATYHLSGLAYHSFINVCLSYLIYTHQWLHFITLSPAREGL